MRLKYQNGGKPPTNPKDGETVKDLLKYLSQHGREFIPNQGLGIDQGGNPDLRENIARRVTDGGTPPVDVEKLKKGIAWVESNNNPSAMNPTTSATGQYQQMYKSLVNEPELTYEDVGDYGYEVSNLMSRDSLANNPALQELLMDRSVHKGIGQRSLLRHGRELTQEFQQQLGDKWNFREDEVAALSHFMGRDRTRQYFASIRDNTPFSIPGTNHTAEMYLKKYNEGINRGN